MIVDERALPSAQAQRIGPLVWQMAFLAGFLTKKAPAREARAGLGFPTSNGVAFGQAAWPGHDLERDRR
jgi:hypothetical protein